MSATTVSPTRRSGGAATITFWSTARRAITASPSSRSVPSSPTSKRGFCGKDDARHASVDDRRRRRRHRPPQFLRPGRRRRARPGDQPEIRPQARLPRRDEGLADRRRDRPQGDPRRRPQHRALRDTTSGRTSSCSASSAIRRSRPRASRRIRRGRRLGRCRAPFRSASTRSSTPGGAIARSTGQASDRGRRLDHIWVTPHLADRLDRDRGGARRARLAAPVRPRPGDRAASRPKRQRPSAAPARRSISLERVARPCRARRRSPSAARRASPASGARHADTR